MTIGITASNCGLVQIRMRKCKSTHIGTTHHIIALKESQQVSQSTQCVRIYLCTICTICIHLCTICTICIHLCTICYVRYVHVCDQCVKYIHSMHYIHSLENNMILIQLIYYTHPINIRITLLHLACCMCQLGMIFDCG